MATLKDIAKKAGLSVTQVSRALNNHSDVNEVTRERVQAVARAMRYQPNLSARKLVSGRSGMIGLVVPHSPDLATDGLFMEVVAGLSTHFSERDMQFVLHIAQKGEAIVPVYQRLIGQGALDGFVLVNPEDDDERAAFLASVDVPFVVHGRIGPDPQHPFFDIDNEGIFCEITRYLMQLGHRRIALLNGVQGRTYVGARLRGHLRALAEGGLDASAAIVRNGEMTEALGLVSTVELFSQGRPGPTAIICSNSRVARGVYQGLAALNLSIPGDVSVMAHDDHLANLQTAAFYPALSVTFAPLRESWEPLAACLADTIAGVPLSGLQRVGPHQTFLRQSTAEPPK